MQADFDLLYVVLYLLTASFLGTLALAMYLIYRLKHAAKQRMTAESKFHELENRVNHLQLETLEAKLNPHLFKNILNSIQSHAYQTYHALDKLAHVLDYILYESRKRFVTPEEEIEFAMNLIEINKIKLSPTFDLRIKTRINETDPMFTQHFIAPLISVDLIENAFKHADFESPDSFISILFEFNDHTFAISVTNKVGRKTELPGKKGGFGSESLHERLRLVYKDNFRLEKTREGTTYKAHLKINLLEHKAQMLAAR